MISYFVDFFSTDVFTVWGGISAIIVALAVLRKFYLFATGISPVLLRLGKGLSSSKIAVFAVGKELESLNNLLIDSKVFKKKNVCSISSEELIKKSTGATVFLVHWKAFGDHIEKIIREAEYCTAIVVYAPRDEGQVSEKALARLNAHSNSILVNFRGRLLNDILTSIITSSYERK